MHPWRIAAFIPSTLAVELTMTSCCLPSKSLLCRIIDSNFHYFRPPPAQKSSCSLLLLRSLTHSLTLIATSFSAPSSFFGERADWRVRRLCRRPGRRGVVVLNDCLICLAGIFTRAHDENSKNLTAREEEEEEDQEQEEIMSPLEVVHCITRFLAKPPPLSSPVPSRPPQHFHQARLLHSAFTGRFSSYLSKGRDNLVLLPWMSRRLANGARETWNSNC